MQQLIACLQRLCVEGGNTSGRAARNKRRRRRRAAAQPGPMPMLAAAASAQPPQPQRRRRRRRNAAGGPTAGLASGQVVLSRREWVKDVALAAAKAEVGISLVLTPENFSWLANMAKAFEQYRWNSMAIEYRPAVGTTTAGLAALGFDWASQEVAIGEDGLLGLTAEPGKKDVLAHSPNSDGPVWSRLSLSVPSARLQSRAWYVLPKDLTKQTLVDYAPGVLVAYANGTASSGGSTLGELWVTYSITLSGTRKV